MFYFLLQELLLSLHCYFVPIFNIYLSLKSFSFSLIVNFHLFIPLVLLKILYFVFIYSFISFSLVFITDFLSFTSFFPLFLTPHLWCFLIIIRVVLSSLYHVLRSLSPFFKILILKTCFSNMFSLSVGILMKAPYSVFSYNNII